MSIQLFKIALSDLWNKHLTSSPKQKRPSIDHYTFDRLHGQPLKIAVKSAITNIRRWALISTWQTMSKKMEVNKTGTTGRNGSALKISGIVLGIPRHLHFVDHCFDSAAVLSEQGKGSTLMSCQWTCVLKIDFLVTLRSWPRSEDGSTLPQSSVEDVYDEDN